MGGAGGGTGGGAEAGAAGGLQAGQVEGRPAAGRGRVPSAGDSEGAGGEGGEAGAPLAARRPWRADGGSESGGWVEGLTAASRRAQRARPTATRSRRNDG